MIFEKKPEAENLIVDSLSATLWAKSMSLLYKTLHVTM
jgi:hypothetical protein